MNTKVCLIDFDPDARCPLWLATLDKFFARADPKQQAELIDYWQRICGYAMVGLIRDHIMPIAYGRGSNGKSTILGTLLGVFGPDYAMMATHDFLAAKKVDGHPTDKADLFGKRLVVAIETEEGRRINESLIKELTGGDKIRARRMRQDSWEFDPTHTMITAGNYKPKVTGQDNGIWRRIRLVPFTVSVEDAEADKAMPDKLMGEAAGILAWCVRGCIEWQKRGLEAPAEVTNATDVYRAEEDMVGLFLAECTNSGDKLKVRSSELYARYSEWANAGNEHVMGQKQFSAAMQARGHEPKRSDGMWWLKLNLKPANDQLAPLTEWLKARFEDGNVAVRPSVDDAGAAGLLRRAEDGSWDANPLWEAGRRLKLLPTSHDGGKVWVRTTRQAEERERGEL